MTSDLPNLHAITSDAILALPDFVERARTVAESGRVAIHIRSKGMEGRSIFLFAEAVKKVCRNTESVVFVNDRADVAKAVGAAGLHLPSSGLSIQQARSIVGSDMWIGRSTHSAREVERASRENADYAFLGPIWPTASHPGQPGIGIEMLKASHGIPLLAIGGVTVERASKCAAHKAYGVAAISAIWNVADIGSATRRMLLSYQI